LIDEHTIKSWEEHAFYEAGLSADGCIQKLGEYELAAIEKYGRMLLKFQKEYLKNSIVNQKEETVSMKISHYESIVSNLDKARREADFYKAKYEALLEEQNVNK
jgi:hypothetical protein